MAHQAIQNEASVEIPGTKEATERLLHGVRQLDAEEVRRESVAYQRFLESKTRKDLSVEDANSLLLLYERGEHPDIAKAIELRERLVQGGLASADDYRDLGSLYVQLHRFDNAIRTYEEALSRPPLERDVELWFNLGLAYAGKGDLVAATSKLRRSLDIARELAASHEVDPELSAREIEMIESALQRIGSKGEAPPP